MKNKPVWEAAGFLGMSEKTLLDTYAIITLIVYGAQPTQSVSGQPRPKR
jgi:hypothetical protein